ncbi:MAG: FkbM family methyltransferase [Gemmatimonadales bacterium]
MRRRTLALLAGPLRLVARPLGRAKLISHRLVGRLVELGGNRVAVAGLRFSVDNPLITTRQKGLLDLGTHESGEIALVRRYLVAELPVVELGGGIGVVSCVINRQLARAEDHVVVEANPDLIPTLEVNRRLNACRFQIHHRALAYGGEETTLAIDSFVTSRVGGAAPRRARVRTTTLASLLDEAAFERINLVADIEGGETDLVEREGPLLARRARMLIIETHARFAGVERTGRMLAALASLGFAEVARVRDVFAFENPALG